MIGEKVVATNRRARHDYHIEESLEAGMVLVGSEVKSLRQGHANLKDSYAIIKEGEVWLLNCHISPYSQANQFNHEPERTRKLLLHKNQIRRLIGKIKERGYTLVPLKIYFKQGRAKLELALVRGKKTYDKRQALREQSDRREIERTLKQKQFG